MLRFLALLGMVICLVSPAEARRHQRVHVQLSAGSQICEDVMCSKMVGHTPGGPTVDFPSRRVLADRTSSGGSTVSHPAGCPGRAFCGCGASVYLFGHSVRELWLAAAWYKFPRAAPAPRMAMVRAHHVAVLIEHRQGSVWLVYDANSGGRQTRIHERSIAGYTIVNPRA